MNYPGQKLFALAIIDDTDVATVENIRPVYDELETCGILATKTVWMKRSTSTHYYRSQTMEDSDYAQYVLALHRKGFEIAFHGASMESSRRDDVIKALHEFRQVFGHFPRMHVNHAANRDNLYWGPERFSSPFIRAILRWYGAHSDMGSDYFQGHIPGSEFYWGDLCAEHIDYVRNFCYDEINQTNINPSQPYHDLRCPMVKFWFSGLDAPDMSTFNRLLSNKNLERLEREGGVCIVATHFGKFFANEGRLNSATRAIFRDLSSRAGWYPTVSVLLDHLRSRTDWKPIGKQELRRLEWRWLLYRFFRARYEMKQT